MRHTGFSVIPAKKSKKQVNDPMYKSPSGAETAQLIGDFKRMNLITRMQTPKIIAAIRGMNVHQLLSSKNE